VHDGAHPGGRVEDWMTLATANALAGREHDARAAWIVALAVGRNPARACRAAMDAYMAWGEALRGSVEALSQRAQQWSGGARTPECEFPLRRLALAQGR